MHTKVVVAFSVAYALWFSGILSPSVTEEPTSSSLRDDASANHSSHDNHKVNSVATATTAHHRRDFVVEMATHAWSGYMAHAAGHDELKPTSKSHKDNWGGTMTTPFDAMDLLLLMGKHDELADALHLVFQADFETSFSASIFETSIRHLAASLSAHVLIGAGNDDTFLTIAKGLADRLLPAFDTPTGIPFHQIALDDPKRKTNEAWCNHKSILAEVGSIQLEFRYLSNLTGDPKYAHAATKFTDHVTKTLQNGWPTDPSLYEHNAPQMPHRGLWPSFVDPTTGKWSGAASFASLSDSFYEYLLKQWILFGKRSDDPLLELYENAVEAVLQKLLRYTRNTHNAFVGHVGMGYEPTLDHLTCFLPGTLILGVMHGAHSHPNRLGRDWGTDDVIQVAVDVASTCYRLYVESPSGIAPEVVQFLPDGSYDVTNPKYILRPELLESLFYLYRFTGDAKYLDWGWHIVQKINEHCRTPVAFAAMTSVLKPGPDNHKDEMESFFFAETLKYAFLLFSDDDVLPLSRFVLNTEGHPFEIPSSSSSSSRLHTGKDEASGGAIRKAFQQARKAAKEAKELREQQRKGVDDD